MKSSNLLVACFAILSVMAGKQVYAETSQAEIAFWQSIANSKYAGEYEAYLSAYPNGNYAPLAKLRLKRLKSFGIANHRKPSTPVRNGNAPSADPLAIKRVNVRLGGNEKGARLGVKIYDTDRTLIWALDLTTAGGATVKSVATDSAAQKFGIKKDQIILSVDGAKIKGSRELAKLIGNRKPGSNVTLEIIDSPLAHKELTLNRMRAKGLGSNEPAKILQLADIAKAPVFAPTGSVLAEEL